MQAYKSIKKHRFECRSRELDSVWNKNLILYYEFFLLHVSIGNFVTIQGLARHDLTIESSYWSQFITTFDQIDTNSKHKVYDERQIISKARKH